MTLDGLLHPSAVRVASSVSSKKRLFQALGDIAESAYGLKASLTSAALQEREALGPTGVGHGVALPHARLDTLDQVRGAFLLLERPLDFNSADRQPVDLVFCLLAPEDSGVDHLKALALVSRTLRDPGVCAKLRSNADSNVLHTILTEGPATQAA